MEFDLKKIPVIQEIKKEIMTLGEEIGKMPEDVYSAFFDSDPRTGYLAAISEVNRKY